MDSLAAVELTKPSKVELQEPVAKTELVAEIGETRIKEMPPKEQMVDAIRSYGNFESAYSQYRSSDPEHPEISTISRANPAIHVSTLGEEQSQDSRKLVPIQVLQIPRPEWLEPGLPNLRFPSDHVPIMAELAVMETVDSKIFLRICGHLEPADVFRLEAVNVSLQLMLRKNADIWTRFRQTKLLPPAPATISHLATDKTIMRLASSPRCSTCLNHGSVIDWNPVWNPAQLRESRKEWQTIVSTRISSIYLRIQGYCCTEILEEALDSEQTWLDELKQSPEWNSVSHLPPIHLVNIRVELKELLDSWFQFNPGQRFRQLDSLAAECRNALTKDVSEYEENAALTKVLHYFNHAVYERRSIRLLESLDDVPCFAGVQYLQCHQIHASDEIDYETEALKFAGWLIVVMDNLSQLVAQVGVGNHAGESYSMQKLLFEICGEGKPSSFEIGRAIWE
ncbi:hypothetical protein HDU81_001091, partial [Chytriomyces hyalinus]